MKIFEEKAKASIISFWLYTLSEMPKFLEDKLKAEYGQNSKIPYKVMNAKGYMRGNKETAKGEALERKHESDVRQHIDNGHRNVRNPAKHAGKLRHI